MQNTAEQIKKWSNKNPTAIGMYQAMRIINSQRSDVSKIHGMINDNRYVSEISCKSADSFTKEPHV